MPGIKAGLNEHALIDWLAARHNMEAVQTDPLKWMKPKVTDVMSYAFAERHRILAVVSTDTAARLCRTEVESWMGDVEHVTRRQVKRAGRAQ